MVNAKVISSEVVTDEKRGGARYEVFIIQVRLGLKTWTIRRKYSAFRSLDAYLQQFFPKAGLEALPGDGAGRERALVVDYLKRLQRLDNVVSSSVVRQFLEVPTTARIIDLTNNKDRSVLSVPLTQLGLELPEGLPEATIFHMVVASSLVLLPALVAPALARVRVPAAAMSLVISLWSLVHKGGLLDEVLMAVLGKEEGGYAREIVRPADMPAVWGAVGMLLGLGLTAHPASSQALAMFAVAAALLAFANLLFVLAKADRVTAAAAEPAAAPEPSAAIQEEDTPAYEFELSEYNGEWLLSEQEGMDALMKVRFGCSATIERDDHNLTHQAPAQPQRAHRHSASAHCCARRSAPRALA